MEIKKRCLKKLLTFAFLTTVGASANAAICDGSTASACGSGELFLNVWDSAAATSYSLDLGVTVNQLANAIVTNQSWNLAQSAVAPMFAPFLTALGAGSTLQYNIAANNTFGNPITNSNFGVVTTFSNTDAEVQAVQPTVALSGISGTMSANVRTRINNLNASMSGDHGGASVTDFPANLDEVSDATEFSYYNDPSWGLDLGGGIGGLATDTGVGGSMALYLMGWGGAGQTSRFSIVGYFSFNNAGLLSYANVPPVAVPIPAAAAWFLGSALFALGMPQWRRRGRTLG